MNVTQLETKLRELQTKAKTLLETQMRACEDHVVTPATATAPEVKGRLRTDEEKAAVQAILDEAKGLKARIDAAKNDSSMLAELDRLTAGMAAAPPTRQPRVPGRGVIVSMGQAFIDSETYEWIKKTNGTRNSRGWTSPSSELPGLEMYAATLTSDPASGGALVVPDYRPGIVEYLFRQLVVADLLAPGTTDSNLISFMRELAPTNAAAPVAEGAAKPESTLVFEAATAPVRKIATWLPVTDEMLEDVPAMRSYIDNRLRMFVQLVEDDQLLNGDGVAPNMLGLRNQVGLQPDVVRGTDTNADAILKQITAIAVNAFIQPDGVVMHPTNWQTIQLSKDANGMYYGSGPFAAPQTPRLWGLPVAVTLAMTAGVAFPGAYRTGAQFFRKGGLRVDASNSHSDFFVKNLTAIRAEERGALAVYRPGGFGEVTGLV
jgi:HK97 family phage major capsid protein